MSIKALSKRLSSVEQGGALIEELIMIHYAIVDAINTEITHSHSDTETTHNWNLSYHLMGGFSDTVNAKFPDCKNIVFIDLPPVNTNKPPKIIRGK